MKSVVENYVLLFFIGSVLGWLMEVICKLIQYHRFINRGFLIGPYCPIYGFGSVLLTILLTPYVNSPVIVFFMGMFICGTLEYLTSYFMEKLFHARWWDYSQKRFNLHGRVCADTLIPFGILGLGMVYIVKPFLFRQFEQIPELLKSGLCGGLLFFLVCDTLISTTVLSKIRSAADKADGDSTEEITRKIRAVLHQKSFLFRRAFRAFPDVHLYNKRLLVMLRDKRRQLQSELKTKKSAFISEVQKQEQALKDELKSRKSK